MINSKEELEKLKKSKYLQSYLGDIDRKVKEELDKGRKVLFSGCPCQIAGLKSFLSKEYENLILVDLLCGNSPSSLFFKKYLESSFPQGVKDYQFRYKKQGWNSDCLTLTLTNGEKIERRGANQDLYQKVYHSHIMCPPHCENCKYQSLPRFGDITIGDFWGYSKRDSSVDVTRGISVVLCNNEKGKQFFHSISEENIELKKSVPLEWIGGNGYALPGKHNWISPLRDKFYKLIQDKSFLEAVKLTFEEEDKTNVPITTFPLCYDSYSSYFRFDSNMWEEHFINNKTVLITKQDNPPFGNFAVIPFRENLKPNTKYTFDIRFKINSNSKEFNLHIVNKDTPKQKLQILKSLKRNDGFHSEWIEIHESFVTKSGEFNGFGIGAAQLSGKEAYFMVDYIIFKERGL